MDMSLQYLHHLNKCNGFYLKIKQDVQGHLSNIVITPPTSSSLMKIMYHQAFRSYFLYQSHVLLVA